MAKSKKTFKWNGETNPEHLKYVATATLLSCFVFIGSFAVGDAAVFMVNGQSALTAGLGGGYYGGYGGDYPPPGGSGGQGGTSGGPADYNGDGVTSPQEHEDFWTNADEKLEELEQAQDDLDKAYRDSEPQSGGGGQGGFVPPDSNSQGQPVGNDASLGGYECLSATGC